MAKPQSTLWNIDPHTQAKHEILHRYLQAWFPILASSDRSLLYIDGFCGPGRYLGGEDGSPLVALKAATAANLQVPVTFWFIDEKKSRIDHLNDEISRLQLPSNFFINVHVGNFTESYPKVIKHSSALDSPTFAFIDPFGYKDIPYELVTELLQRKSCEIFVNVMVEFMNRFLETDDAKVREHIRKAFGTDDCLRIAESAGQDRLLQMRNLYESQLRKSANFVRSFEMSNVSQRTIYYLFFASNHELGHYRMKEAMWKVDPAGEFRFTDRTNRQLNVLGDKVHNTASLLSQLEERFAGEGLVPVEKIKRFVRNETAFLEPHLSEGLKRAELSGSVRVHEKNVDGTNRRKNSFSKAQVEFASNKQLRLNL